MTLWRSFLLIFLAATIVVAAFAGCTAGFGQRNDGPLAKGNRGTFTVSVASLRIPQRAWRHFEKAKAAAERNRPAESERETTEAIEIAPGFAEAYLLRATQQMRTRSYDAAVASVVSAESAEPGVMWAGVVLAGAYNGLHRYRDAGIVLDALRGPEAETWQAKYEQARAETGSSNAESALRWSAMALQAAPRENADVHLVRANALLLADRWAEAALQMEAYLRSKQPLVHRDEVMQKLSETKERLGKSQLAAVRSR